MKQLDYTLLDKKIIIQSRIAYIKEHKSTFLDENRHSKLFKDDKVNDYINAQLRKASKELDKRLHGENLLEEKGPVLTKKK